MNICKKGQIALTSKIKTGDWRTILFHLVPFWIWIFFNVYLFLRQCKQGRGRERGRHRIQSKLQALNCQHRAWHGAWTHELWDHDLSRSQTLNRLSHPGAPRLRIFLPTFGAVVGWRVPRCPVLLTQSGTSSSGREELGVCVSSGPGGITVQLWVCPHIPAARHLGDLAGKWPGFCTSAEEVTFTKQPPYAIHGALPTC